MSILVVEETKMHRIFNLSGKLILGSAAALVISAPSGPADAKGFTVLYEFQGSDGYAPNGLLLDKRGNLYGTTYFGGPDVDDGVVFKLAPDGKETLLHAFTGGSDGEDASSGLIADKAGNLYGTTAFGGTTCGEAGCGTVYKIASGKNETVLYGFTDGSDGGFPVGTLLADKQGNFYDTAEYGGIGYGVVYKLAPDGTQTTLYTFQGTNGALPIGNLISDKGGNLYGMTYFGGEEGCLMDQGCGTVFKLALDGSETTLMQFSSTNNLGTNPVGGLIANKKGNFYGATELGGLASGCGGEGCGVVFEITADGTYKILYTFQGGADGESPAGGLIADDQGNLYGTTFGGGTDDKGVVFKLTPKGRETVLHSFTGGADGANPSATLIADGKGNLYGTTSYGGNPICGGTFPGCGTVFKLKE
jgi:uncharacterized repeat protein (TIGR03803 family)